MTQKEQMEKSFEQVHLSKYNKKAKILKSHQEMRTSPSGPESMFASEDARPGLTNSSNFDKI
jgi:hypothetical protein